MRCAPTPNGVLVFQLLLFTLHDMHHSRLLFQFPVSSFHLPQLFFSCCLFIYVLGHVSLKLYGMKISLESPSVLAIRQHRSRLVAFRKNTTIFDDFPKLISFYCDRQIFSLYMLLHLFIFFFLI